MTERDFDKFFKDRLDDEQEFEFRSDDWSAAASELDKVMPVSTPVVATPQPRLLTWHKWAAAAAILILGSQAWLMNKIFDLKHEIVSLKTENSRLAQQNETAVTEKRYEIVVQYDTITKTVTIEKPVYNSPILKNALPNTQIADNDNGQPKSMLTVENTKVEAKYQQMEGDKKMIKNNDVADNKGNQVNKNDVITHKNNIIAQNDTFNTSTKVDKSILDMPTVAQTELANLPNITVEAVKSNRLNQAKLEIQELMPIIQHQAKPALFTNGWVVGINVLGQLDRKNYNKNSEIELESGYNARLSYQLRSNWRIAADVDFWSECRPHPDSTHRPPFQPPTPDYNLSRVEMKQKKVQIRLGSDYEFVNKSIVTPFVGMGLVYQITTKDDIEYQFKSPRNPTIPVSVRNDKKPMVKPNPIYLSLRAGLSGTIYKRMGWSLDVTKDMPFRGISEKPLSGHIGLTYAL